MAVYKHEAINLIFNLPVVEQLHLAIRLASNCGYKLVPENSEQSKQDKGPFNLCYDKR